MKTALGIFKLNKYMRTLNMIMLLKRKRAAEKINRNEMKSSRLFRMGKNHTHLIEYPSSP